MKRYNEGKPRLSLVPTTFLLAMGKDPSVVPFIEATAKVLDFGATKYEANNWRKSGPWLKIVDSCLRHYEKLIYFGEQVDPESGIDHVGHIGCNLAFLMEYIVEKSGEDNRFATQQKITHFGPDRLWNSYAHVLNWRDGGPGSELDKAASDIAQWYHNQLNQPKDAQLIPQWSFVDKGITF